MPLRFYNTMTRNKEPFEPLNPGDVRMYNCGPTVYNYAHIGNFRAYIFEDLLKRYLKFKGYKVIQVMNLTDVDDKIIKKCAESGISLQEYTETFKAAFFKDLETLNIDKAEYYPAATEHIREMVELVKKLLEKGLAYRAEDGNIFFKISAFPGYGKLQHLDMSQMRSGARVNEDEYDKESANDFALWKAYKPEDGNVYWDTELGKGRPGWHIECSAMSMKYLGETFDIHTGGVDNLFPHHENEIAQSEGATGKPFVKYWLHCEHLLWKNSKMSKSLGNIIYINGLIEKGYSPAAIRYTLLSTHYRQKLNFSPELLEASENTLKRINDFLFSLQHTAPGPDSAKITVATKRMLQCFEEEMDDDLGISPALSALFEGIREINRQISRRPPTPGDRDRIMKALRSIDSVLGVIFFNQEKKKNTVDDAFIREKIAERNAARANKNWAAADKIRDELAEMGVELLDLKTGTEYKIKS
ncbi:MAG: cysteine--tRNA ligase [Candidatus Marinimicrobia bacterium]|nr:cysteine--tRNA ligase [Candidatus Neomarinimicrobiota bacterium]